MGDKTTIFHEQNTVCNGYYILSERNDNLQSGYCEAFLVYNNVDSFVDEFTKPEKNGFPF